MWSKRIKEVREMKKKLSYNMLLLAVGTHFKTVLAVFPILYQKFLSEPVNSDILIFLGQYFLFTLIQGGSSSVSLVFMHYRWTFWTYYSGSDHQSETQLLKAVRMQVVLNLQFHWPISQWFMWEHPCSKAWKLRQIPCLGSIGCSPA